MKLHHEKKNVLFIANSNLEYNFAIRLNDALFKIGYRFTVSTLKPSLLLKLKRNGIKSFLIKRIKNNINLPELNKLVRISNNLLTEDEILTLFVSIYDHVKQLLDKHMVDLIFIWNGLGLISLPLSKVAKDNGVPRVYFELANIPGKIFVDPEGVNASSSLYKNIDILKNYEATDSQFQEWKNEYILFKSENLPIPQVDRSNSKHNWLYIIDYLTCRTLITPLSGDYTIFRKLRTKFKSSTLKYHCSYDLMCKDYIFLPLQVDSDTQLVFNSEISNLDAIKIASDLSLSNGLELIVKPHPASFNEKELNEILNFKKKLGFKITNKNSFELINNAKEIVTINSSVGLEGIILDKKVTFLGKSFFPKLNENNLKNYILSYLIDIDYFSDETIDQREIFRIIERIKAD